jgi:predicted peroxiredoxin
MNHLQSIGLLGGIAVLALSIAAPAAASDGVFIHLSHGLEHADEHGEGDSHSHAGRVLMALTMAEIMSTDRDVLMYVDTGGVDVVLKDSKDISSPHYGSSKAMIGKLLERGVEIYVCPSCLKAAGKTESDVMKGVKIANKDAFFNFTDGRILSLSY